MSILVDFLYDRINQLRARKETILEISKRKDVVRGKGFRTEDIPKIDLQIEETKAALKGISEWEKGKKPINKKGSRIL